MKALLFNHHPDHFWEYKKTLESLGIEPYFATEELGLKYGAEYYSINSEFKWRRGPLWFDPKNLFEDNFKYASSIDEFDYIFTMNIETANNINFNPKKLFFIAPVYPNLLEMNNYEKYVKITAHSRAKEFGGHYIPRFVPMNGKLDNKIYITQLMENYKNSIFYQELLSLKQAGHPVIIAGDPRAPDGIVWDWNVLRQTSMLVHYKDYGIACTAVLKALECGIPIYTSKENRIHMGFEKVPEYCFIFSDDMNIKEGFEFSKTVDNYLIQNTYRSIFNINNTANRLQKIL